MIRIVTDSASDITPRQAMEMDVQLVSLSVGFEHVIYDAQADESYELFYKLLGTEKDLPKTSQPTPAEYLAIFSDAKENGDDVICITLTATLSGTWQVATLAAEMAEYDRVYVLDSHNATLGQRLMVEYAVKLREEGKSAAEIMAVLTEARERVVLYAALDTLKYLRKGGRIPKSMEMLGTVMGIKPVITLKDGHVVMAAKARGHAGIMASMVKLVEQGAAVDPACPVYFGYTYVDDDCRKYRKLIKARYKMEDTHTYSVGPVIGTHIGPGAFAIMYLGKTKHE